MLRTITEKERIAFFIDCGYVVNLTPSENSALLDVDKDVPLKGQASSLLTKNCYTLDEMSDLNLWFVNEFTAMPLVRKSFNEGNIQFEISNPVFGILTTEDFKRRLSDEGRDKFEKWMGPQKPIEILAKPYLKFHIQSDLNRRVLSWESEGKILGSNTLFCLGWGKDDFPDGNYNSAQIEDLHLYQVIDHVAYSFFANPEKGRKYYVNLSNGLYPLYYIKQSRVHELD